MPGDLSQVAGHTLPDKPVAWNKRDLLTYAAGVGAKKDEFHFVYELDPNFSMIPTYPVVLGLKGADQDVNLFAERFKGRPIPGMPPLSPNRVVHATQSIEIIKDLPLVSGQGWTWRTRYTGVVENKSGIILTTENTLVDPKGEIYVKLYSSSFNLGAKATGERFAKSIAGPPQGSQSIAKLKDASAPDHFVTEQTSPEQAIIFRLSGDYNPLHIDPKIGETAGFGGVILHGLSTYGFGARAVIATAGAGNPRSLRFFSVRFTAPVRPGDVLETAIWVVGPVKGVQGLTEIAFETTNKATGKVVLGGGVAHITRGTGNKL